MIHISLIFDQTYWAINLHRFNHWLYHKGHRRIACAIYLAVRWLTNIDIYPAATIGKNLKMPHGFGIVIGETVEIGDDVVILQQVTIGASHVKNIYTKSDFPTIKNGVILGTGSKILGGITIHEGAIIGANAVVLKSVPAGCVAVGVPARIIKKNSAEFSHHALKPGAKF